MGMFDALQNQTFRAPDFNAGNNPQLLTDFVNYKNSRPQQQLDFESALDNMRRVNHANDFIRNFSVQQNLDKIHSLPNLNPTGSAPGMNPNGMNVVFRDLIDPYHRGVLENSAERNKITEQNNLMKNNVAEQNVGIKDKLANDPNYQRVVSKGGTVQYIDKKTGKVIDTGVESGTETDEEKNTATSKLTEQKTNAAKDLESQKATERSNLQDKKGDQIINRIHEQGKENRLTKGAPSPNASANLPSQQLVATKNRANEFINRNPDLGQFVSIDPTTGLVQIQQPSTDFLGNPKGPTAAQYQQILQAVYPPNSSPNTAPAPNTAPKSSGFSMTSPYQTDWIRPAPGLSNVPQTPGGNMTLSNGTFTNNPNSGNVRVRLPDGRTGTMPAKDAMQPGVTIIGGPGGEQ